MGVFQGLPPMPVFRAVSYRMQIVAGTNYLIKVRGTFCYFLLIFRFIILFLFLIRLSIFSWSFYTEFFDTVFALNDFFPTLKILLLSSLTSVKKKRVSPKYVITFIYFVSYFINYHKIVYIYVNVYIIFINPNIYS